MKILLFLIPSLVILFSCTKDKTPPKDECIEPYVGDYKVIELRKADGTIIPEDKIRDSLHADHAWIERRLIYQQSAPYGPERWIYEFKWKPNILVRHCNGFLTLEGVSINSNVFPFESEMMPDTTIFINKNGNYYSITNLKNTSSLKIVKQ